MKKCFKAFVLALIVLPLTSCSSDDDDNVVLTGPTGATKVYSLGSVSNPSISGTATFIENYEGSTTIELQLNGTPDGGMHPAHIHVGTAIDQGAIALTLGVVDGTTGFSSITTSELNDGTSVSYEELLDFDGYINVHLSADNLASLVAQGDIGQNEFTGNSTTYALGSVADPAISGTINFKERASGSALATIMLSGTPDDGRHPAHIHNGSVAEAPGSIRFTFAPVQGSTGMSMTNMDDPYDPEGVTDQSALSYDEVVDYDGYVNVHISAADLDTLVAQGNIGSNN